MIERRWRRRIQNPSALLSVATASAIVFAGGAGSQETPAGNGTATFPPRVGYVMDLADVVSAEARNTIEDIASEVRRKSKGDILVVTMQSLGGSSPDSIAGVLTQYWDVGYRGMPDDPANDTGVLILLSLDEREFSIQVQEGMRAFFPEAAIRTLVTSKVVQPFRAGDYSTGLVESVRGVAQVFAQRFQFLLESGP